MIDRIGACDLDDALSVKKNDNGTYDIGAHIANILHFVKVNTPLDHDAHKRATSVYFVQHTMPMLPPRKIHQWSLNTDLDDQVCRVHLGNLDHSITRKIVGLTGWLVTVDLKMLKLLPNHILHSALGVIRRGTITVCLLVYL